MPTPPSPASLAGSEIAVPRSQPEPRDTAAQSPDLRPILLLSACPRSGSHYLEALLLLHPQCCRSRIPEDFFLANSATLISFCQSLVESWEEAPVGLDALVAQIGAALVDFAHAPRTAESDCSARRLLLRSPTTEGITRAPMLFPDARIVLLVRDGPATVESGRRSFGWWYEEGMLRWRTAVREIIAGARDGVSPWHLVRFEDLVANPVPEMQKVAGFVGLDVAAYPFDRIAEVAVVGSSSFGRKSGEAVHWRSVPRDGSFDPLARANAWPLHRRKRFSWLAGAELRYLGYVAVPLSPLDCAANVVLDAWHLLRRVIVRIVVSRRIRLRVFSDRQRRYLSWPQIRIVT